MVQLGLLEKVGFASRDSTAEYKVLPTLISSGKGKTDSRTLPNKLSTVLSIRSQKVK